MKRSIVIALVASAVFRESTPANAQEVNPKPSAARCPGGALRLVWDYPFAGGIPANATTTECDNPDGCPAFPASACLQIADVPVPLNKGDRPDVQGDPPEIRDRIPVPRRPPRVRSQRPMSPAGQKAAEVPVPANDGCIAGTGWDFERVLIDVARPGAFYASLDKWTGDTATFSSPFRDQITSDMNLKAAPVYGNAAPIDRIRPPGWTPSIEQEIGGDYWKYSVPINQHGDFWISSLYRRYSWKQHPGDTRDESAVGTLTSPGCRLGADFLTFRMSGSRSSAQRVELQVRGGRARDYVGIPFPNSLGDPQFGGARGHWTQSTLTPKATPLFRPPDRGFWVVVRSATVEDAIDALGGVPSVEYLDRSEWMQTYVFDVRPFRGRDVRIRIVDDARLDCAVLTAGGCELLAPEHINVDYLVFADGAPAGTRWMPIDGGQCDDATRTGCGPIGRVPSRPPLWGVTDAHAHPMANLAFGGHVFWGDVSDTLQDVYDCTRPLPAVPGSGGRDAISAPAQSNACFLAGDIVIIVGATAHAGCNALAVIPVLGLVAASACHAAVNIGAASLLSTPVMEGLTLHGARKFSSGGLRAGLLFSKAWLQVMQALGKEMGDQTAAFETGLMAQVDKWQDARPTVSWYRDDSSDQPDKVDWHSFTGLGKSHNLYQADMIRRAHAGGMRLGVWDVVNSRALAFVADGAIMSDWSAIKLQTDAAKRIVGTTLKDIAAIAYTPEQAEDIIDSGQLAVILGTEVDELGRMRPDGLPWPRSPHTLGDSMQKQIDDLWEMGIRKITPVHAVNNPIGGPALFYDQYASNNHFLNGTPVDGEPSFFDLPAVRFVVDRSPWLPFELVLGKFAVFRRVGDNAGRSWNPGGWFNFDTAPPPDGVFAGDTSVTWRLGQGEKALRTADGTAWLPPSAVLEKQILSATAMADLATLIRPIGRCNLFNTFKPDPVTSFGPAIDAQYVAANGHRNALGIFRNGAQDGVAFLRAAMKKGMILDADHMSQRMRDESYRLADEYARQAGWTGDYPFMGVHTTVRDLEKEGNKRLDTLGMFGTSDESTRTPREIEYVAANGGTVGVFPRGSAFIPPNTAGGFCTKHSDCGGWKGPGSIACNLATQKCLSDTPQPGVVLAPRNWSLPAEVENDCDASSKTFAVKYLWLMERMKGRGLTLTTDLNGLIGTIQPRFGGATPGKDVCGGVEKRSAVNGDKDRVRWWDIMVQMQWYEHTGVWYDDYDALGAHESPHAAGWTDTGGPHKRWREVNARSKTGIREDVAPRWTTKDEFVYFNDHGPDLAPLYWFDQDANVAGAQLWPMKRWRNFRDGWDFNLDGLQHIGLLPDLVQDIRNVGVQWEQLGPLFRGAQDYLDLWRRSIAIGSAHP